MREIYQYDLNGNFIKKWDSVRGVSLTLNIDSSSITQVCSGKRKSCGGFKWALGELKFT